MSQGIKENEFASDKGFDDITKFKDGGVKKKMLRSGKGARPTEFAECEIQYIGYFTSGKVWANTYRGYDKSVTFQLKKNKVIYGWEIAVTSMKKGEKARFKISSAYAYGANGLPPSIPPDTNLVFDVELVDWKSMKNQKDRFMEKTSQSYEQLVQGAVKEKEQGNELFKAGEYLEAVERYQEALQYARFVYEPKLRHTTRPLMLACELNMAFCHLKLKQWREAIKACDEALKMDQHEAKAYFRKAVAHRMLGQNADAKRNILQAKRLDGADPGIDRELALIEWQWEQHKKRERKIFVNLFDDEAIASTDYAEAPEQALASGDGKQQPQRAAPLFKEDKERIKKGGPLSDVTLPGEEGLLDAKWGGGNDASDPALPRGDLALSEASAAPSNGADDGNDDDMPGLEPNEPQKKPADINTVAAKPAAVSASKPAVAAVAATSMPSPSADADLPPLEDISSDDDGERPAVKKSAPTIADEPYVYDNRITNERNPLVFLNFAVDGAPAGKVVVELFMDRAPRTAENFRKLCTGEKGKSALLPDVALHYKGCKMHRLVRDYIIQGGDLVKGNGMGAIVSCNGGGFEDERLDTPLDREGLLCMASQGPGTRTVGSQFFFTLVDCSHLNGHYVVIGKVVEGIEVLLDDLQEVETDANDCPRKAITIRNCGDFDGF